MKRLNSILALILALIISLSSCVMPPNTVTARADVKSVELTCGDTANGYYTFNCNVSNLEGLILTSSDKNVATVETVKSENNRIDFKIAAISAGVAEILPKTSGTDIDADKITVTVKNSTESNGGLPGGIDSPYEVLNGGIPEFLESDYTTTAYEYYSPLDKLGRCGFAMACVGVETMPAPDEERGSISNVNPSGWIQAEYDFVSGKYLYNRSHLIGWQLSAENDNERNLITGTRYFNVEGMLPFENMVADYVKETGHHVIYRVTPMYEGDNLLASGVKMEAYSVEDEGEDICFNVFVYNIQPGVKINYATGESRVAEAGDTDVPQIPEDTTVGDNTNTGSETVTYIVNTSTKKFHKSDCYYAKSMSEANRLEFEGTREEAIDEGYSPCGVCDP